MIKDFTGLMLILLIGIFAIAAATLASVHLKADKIEANIREKAFDLKNSVIYETHKIAQDEYEHFYKLQEQLQELLERLTPEDDTETLVSVDEVIKALENMKNKGV